ncbi:hypothetical protein Tco_0621105 [Tanacetum coccineum]
MIGRLSRLRDRAHMQRLCTSENKGRSVVLVGSIKYSALSFSLEPCSAHRRLWVPQRLEALFWMGFVVYWAYGGEPTLSLFTLGYARDWLTFQKRVGNSIPVVFKPSMLNILEPFDMTLKDFLQFLRNHPVSVVVVPTDAPLSAGSSNIAVVNILKENVEMQPADLGVGVFPPRAKRVSTAAHPALWGAMPAFALVSLSSKGKV